MNTFMKTFLCVAAMSFGPTAIAEDSAPPARISATMSAISPKTATLVLANDSQAPQAVLVKIFNQHPHKLVSEIAVNVPASSRVSVDAEALPGEAFARPISWQYNYMDGKFVSADIDNNFQLPFGVGVNVRACQTPDGPITTHHERINAIDFCAAEGTPIVAAKDGVVIEVVDFYTEGGKRLELLPKINKVVIMHDDGLQTFYGHIYPNSAKVKVGDNVIKGQEIAQVGNVGYSSGPHLHFEVIEIVPKLNSKNQLTNTTIKPNFVNPKHKPIRLEYLKVYNLNGPIDGEKTRLAANEEKIDTPLSPLHTTKENDAEPQLDLEINVLRKYIALNKTNSRAYEMLAVALTRNKQYAESIPYFEKRVSMKNYNYETCVYYAISLAATGKVAEAIVWNKRALDFAPTSVVWNNQQMSSATPTLVDVTRTLAFQLAETGKKEEAVALLQNADNTRYQKGQHSVFSHEIHRLRSTN